MRDWIIKLDDFRKLNQREILDNARRISARLAEEIACKEFEKYWERQNQIEQPDPVPALEKSVQKVRAQREKAKD